MAEQETQAVKIDDIKTIGVIGAGQMGGGIAHVCSLAGYDVQISDLGEAELQKGLETIAFNMERQVSRGKISEAEKQAAQMIAEAAHTLASEEQALQVRYLQTLKEIANERTNTIVFPLPLELIEPIVKMGKSRGA